MKEHIRTIPHIQKAAENSACSARLMMPRDRRWYVSQPHHNNSNLTNNYYTIQQV